MYFERFILPASVDPAQRVEALENRHRRVLYLDAESTKRARFQVPDRGRGELNLLHLAEQVGEQRGREEAGQGREREEAVAAVVQARHARSALGRSDLRLVLDARWAELVTGTGGNIQKN